MLRHAAGVAFNKDATAARASSASTPQQRAGAGAGAGASAEVVAPPPRTPSQGSGGDGVELQHAAPALLEKEVRVDLQTLSRASFPPAPTRGCVRRHCSVQCSTRLAPPFMRTACFMRAGITMCVDLMSQSAL